MRSEIQIPATLDHIQVVRIFTCTVDTMRLGEPDLTSHFTDIDIGDGVEIDHGLAISTIEAWRRQSRIGFALVFAYQALAISRISDDRSEWNHRGRISETVLLPITPKTYVLDASWVRTFTLAWLRDDVEWVRAVSMRDRWIEEAPEVQRRLVNRSTIFAYRKLREQHPELSDDHMLLKLGAGAYVPFGGEMIYRPELAANTGVRLSR